MKGVLVTGGAALVIGIGLGAVLAQQQPQIRPYYVGNALGVPIAPPAPTVADPPPFTPMSDNVKVYGSLINVESCSYDPVRGLIVAPNRFNAQSVRANDAFVSLINHDGSVHTPRWIGIQNPGAQRDNMDPPLVLNFPLGSMIVDNVLYLADRDGGTGPDDPSISVIRWFSMEDGRPLGEHRVPESTGFNDLWVTEDGVVYATQTGMGGATPNPDTWQVWRVTLGGEHSIVIQGEPLRQPNGIAMDNDGNLVVVNIGNNEVNVFTTEGEHVRTATASRSCMTARSSSAV
jgi:hypothetical protein